MKSILKKLCKAALALSLVFTGILYSTVTAKANDLEVQPYASGTTITYKTFSDILSFGTSGNKGVIDLDVKMRLATDSLGTTMTYYSSSCAPGSGTSSCSIYGADVHSYANYTSNYDSNTMIVDFYIKTVKNSTTYYTVYTYKYKNNKIIEQYVSKNPNTSKHTVQDK